MCENRVRDVLNAGGGATVGEEAPKSNDTGRDARGRFTVGNRGGPGNPFGRLAAQLRSAFMQELTEADMHAAARALIDRAVAGNLQALKLMLQYSIGKPAEPVNPDHVEIDEWKYFKQTAAMSGEVDGVVKSMEPEVVLEMGRNVRPILSELAREQIVTALSTGDDSVFRPKKSPSPNGGIGGLTSLLGGKVGKRRAKSPSPNGGERRPHDEGPVPCSNGVAPSQVA